MRTAITGHRPEKLAGAESWVKSALAQAYKDLGITCVVQGMAAGVDLVAARVAHENDIPFVCAKPWKTHKGRMGGSAGFSSSWNIDYEEALRYAQEVVDVTDYEDYPGAWVYQKRNEWMVDNSEMLIAVWNGDKQGGTWNCVKYAMKQNVTIYRLDPVTETAAWYA